MSEFKTELDKAIAEAQDKLKERKQRFDCARANCPFNFEGQRCINVERWFVCLRHVEP